MKKIKISLLTKLFIVTILLAGCVRNVDENYSQRNLSGPYLGQTPPGNEPELFAPGVITTPLYTRDIAMTPDGDEIYFCVSALGYNLIFYTKQIDGKWTQPKVAPFITQMEYMHYEPHITPDGKKLLFLSNMPTENRPDGNEDIWAVDRSGENWGEPYNLGEPVNSEHSEFFPSVTYDGTLYFSRQFVGERETSIYRSKLINGKYAQPEKLPPQVNCGTNRFNAYISRDESFIITPAVGMEDSYGSTDYYIVFRDEHDDWSQPINLGHKINTESGREYSPYISPDGKYFFFMCTKTDLDSNVVSSKLTLSFFVERFNKPQNGNSNIYWIDASFIDKLRSQI